MARAACILARQLRPKALVTITHSGLTALHIAKYRPFGQIIAITGREKILRRLNLVWGVRGLLIPDLSTDIDAAYEQIKRLMKEDGLVDSGDYVVYTAGLPLMSKGTTNSVKVARVD